MPFSASLAPDITEGLPAAISARASAAAATWANSGVRYDIAVGGLPFILAISEQRPYRRQSAELRKQQIDTSKEAGEQTLGQWWTRSQDSWHRGEGITFYEPGSDEGTQYRFGHSVGVDVWTIGQASLLHSTTKISTVTAGQPALCATGGSGNYYTLENTTLRRRTVSASTAYTPTGTVPTTGPAVAGSKVLVGHSTGIDVGDASGSVLTSLYTSTGGVVTPWYAKSRIIAARGADLFELAVTPASPPLAIGTPFYTHPLTSWVWSAVADSPGAILAAGYSGGQSVVYKFALEDAAAGATPKLGQAYQVAEFPPGEQVTAMRVYLGQYVAIGTSRGIRVGVVDPQGSINYGPLIVETTSPVLDFAARDSFVFAAVTDAIDGQSGAVRINLGEEITDLRYAWAWDAQTHVNGPCTGVAFIGGTDRMVLGVTGQGVYLQSDTLYEPSGYITSGRIRYATSELKSFKRVRINARADAAGSGVNIATVDNRDSERSVFKVSAVDGDGVDVGLNLLAPLPNLSIKLRLDSSTDRLTSPVLDSMVLKAMPAVRPQRLIQYPLLCMDEESDRHNNKVRGTASARLDMLEELEAGQLSMIVQDFRTGESFEAQVENLEFTVPAAPDKQETNYGGYVTLTVRKLT